MVCPQCGAPLAPGPKRRVIRCEHCGSRLDPDAEEGPASTRQPSPEQTGRPLSSPAAPRHAHRWWLAVVPALISYAVYTAAWQAAPAPRPVSSPVPPRPTPPPPAEKSAAPAPAPRVLPGLLLVPDGRARGAENLVAAVEEPGANRQRWLGAFDAATGEVLWRWPLDRDRALADAPRSVIDETLLVASPSTVYALSLQTGQVSWSRDTGGPPDFLCSGDGYAGLSFPNQRFVAFSVATGSSVTGRPERCAEVSSSRSVAPNFSVVEGSALDPPLPGRAPLDVERALVPHRGAARVLLGSDASGLARLAVATHSRWLWDARLGRDAANRARLLSPPLAAVRNERVVVPYVLSSPAELRLASFELATGRLIWDEALVAARTASGDTVAEDSARVAAAPRAELRLSRAGTIYFSNGEGQLWVVDSDSRLLWKMGRG